ncbi:hypothetical protein LR48_Vigan05g061700 [Vigna angularis]|uniref:Uncharacterized protein n=1 Tax=Phaseolus angularis TaxID=3914 RepID=A0A0L9UJT8_PHAAN|nr:hypothetical protein LR48_Vigan05g061700 [Vigna angularis]
MFNGVMQFLWLTLPSGIRLRQDIKCLPAAGVLSGAEISSNQFEDFSVSVAEKDDTRELKVQTMFSPFARFRIVVLVLSRLEAACVGGGGLRENEVEREGHGSGGEEEKRVVNGGHFQSQKRGTT